MKLFKGLLMLVGGGVLLVIALMVIIAVNVPTDPEAIEASAEKFIEKAEKQAAQKSAQQITLGKSSLRSDSFATHISFPITNTTNTLLNYADFKVFVYDSNDKVLGSGIANVTNVPAKESRTLEAMIMQVDAARIARHEVQFGNSMFD